MADSLRGYPEYKESGVEWLGAIPSHWQIRRAKYVFRESDVRSITGKEELLSVSHITGVTPRSQKNVTMFKAESYAGSKICEPSDLVINTMWAWMGALGVSQYSGIVSPSYGVYRATDEKSFLSEYLDRLLRTPLYIAEYVRRSTGIRSSRLRLYPEQFLEIPLVQPTIDDQKAIVRFLDAADQRIRRYIRAKQKLIKLLNEQKKGIIQRAVTRGLDPTVPMKDSGVEWLGAIPSHWEIQPIKRMTTPIEQGWSPQCYAQPAGKDEWGVLKVGCVNGGVFKAEENKRLPPELNPLSDLEIQSGDILVSRANTRELVGSAAYVEKVRPRLLLSDKLFRIRLTRKRLLPKFLIYVLSSRSSRVQIESAATGASSSMQNIGQSTIADLIIPLPPLVEQAAIVQELTSLLSDSNVLIEYTNQQIDLVRDYRTRLIADVVTGKLDVRKAAFAIPAELDEGESVDGSEDEADEFSDEDAELEEMTDAE